MHLPHLLPFAKCPLYFFTACAAGRRAVFESSVAQEALLAVWRMSADQDGWFVGKYVIMPNHVHFFARPGPGAKNRAKWCKAWKSISARRLIRSQRISPPIWQPDTFDHILRSAKSYSEKWDYVRANPVRAGLIDDASVWPGSGEIHPLSF
ncbi:MAG: transposase [Opitutaceae bacterium]|nr:transposase [Opitutaceae bacterium]